MGNLHYGLISPISHKRQHFVLRQSAACVCALPGRPGWLSAAGAGSIPTPAGAWGTIPDPTMVSAFHFYY